MQVGSLISVGCPRFRKTTCDPAKYPVPAVSSAAPATSVAITVSAKRETPNVARLVKAFCSSAVQFVPS